MESSTKVTAPKDQAKKLGAVDLVIARAEALKGLALAIKWSLQADDPDVDQDEVARIIMINLDGSAKDSLTESIDALGEALG
ncbi:MAG TPA: hypothetical protein VI432_03035 [Candidatus Paceibacterota bacterium]